HPWHGLWRTPSCGHRNGPSFLVRRRQKQAAADSHSGIRPRHRRLADVRARPRYAHPTVQGCILMDMLSNLALGLQVAFTPTNLLYCFFGVFLGTVIGVLPGIGSLAAVSMLLPISFYLDPTTALVLLAGVYYGAEYG